VSGIRLGVGGVNKFNLMVRIGRFTVEDSEEVPFPVQTFDNSMVVDVMRPID
jgi:hypothetical protein